jgi:Predicted amidophosphoribosyltransferases
LPTDEQSLQTRRFNLPALLLDELNIGLHTATIFPLLIEKKVKQNSLMRNERMRNASQMYAISDEGATIIQQKRWQEIVLIDDVYTTGSTMMRGIAAVKKKTDTKISSFTLFR